MCSYKDYGYINDLVGTDRAWGSVKELSRWQAALYKRWLSAIYRCNDPSNKRYPLYGAVGITFDFKRISDYYECLKLDPLWKDFVKDPDSYDIDKDIKCGHGSSYNKDTIKIVFKKDNLKEANVRNRSSSSGIFSSESRRKVVDNLRGGWEYCQVVLVDYGHGEEVSSPSEVAKKAGVTMSSVCDWLANRNKGYKRHGIVSIRR